MKKGKVPQSVVQLGFKIKALHETMTDIKEFPPKSPPVDPPDEASGSFPKVPVIVGVDFGATYVFGACAIYGDGTMKNLAIRNETVSNQSSNLSRALLKHKKSTTGVSDTEAKLFRYDYECSVSKFVEATRR